MKSCCLFGVLVLIGLHGTRVCGGADRYGEMGEDICGRSPVSLKENENGIIALASLDDLDITNCTFKVTFSHLFSYYGNENVVLHISLASMVCMFNVELYLDANSPGKRPVTTLSCRDNLSWDGHWPSKDVYLKLNTVNESVNSSVLSFESSHSENTSVKLLNVRFNTCHRLMCYKFLRREYGAKVKYLENHKYGVNCLDNSFVVYKSRYMWNRFCNRISFSVKDNVPVCFRFWTESFQRQFKDNKCKAKVYLDGIQVFELKYILKSDWCIPWDLTGKEVKFQIENSEGRGYCRCHAKIVTNTSSSSYKSTCPKPVTTTKRWEWSAWSTGYDNENESYYDDDEGDYSALWGILALAIPTICGCICVGTCKRSSRNNQNENTTPDDENSRMNLTSSYRTDRPTYPRIAQGYSGTSTQYSQLPQSPTATNTGTTRDYSHPSPSYSDAIRNYSGSASTHTGPSAPYTGSASTFTGPPIPYEEVTSPDYHPLSTNDAYSSRTNQTNPEQFINQRHQNISEDQRLDGYHQPSDGISDLEHNNQSHHSLEDLNDDRTELEHSEPPPPSYEEACANDMYLLR